MGPITGIRPVDERWGGEMPEEYVEAIFNDVSDDIPAMIEGGLEAEDLVPTVITQAIMRTAQRLAVELDGCEIDLSTIFEHELIDEDEDEDEGNDGE